MTGPEHYKQAEKILGGLDEVRDTLKSGTAADVNAGIALINGLIAEAQIHATLALTAATASAGNLDGSNDMGEPTDWHQVIYP